MKRFVQHAVARSQFSVGALVCPQVYSHPRRDFEIARSAKHGIHRSQQTRERVSHDVGRDPGASLLFHVFVKRSPEIIPVAVLAVRFFRMQHERFAQPVLIADECLEFGRHWNPTFFEVFEIDRGRLAEIDAAVSQVEPPRHGFDYLQCPPTGVESAIENIFQILSVAFTDELGHQFARTEIFSRRGGRSFDIKIEARIVASQMFGHAPIEKAADRHVITVSRLCVQGVQFAFVKSLHVILVHAIGCDLSAERGEQTKRVDLRLRRSPRPTFARAAFAGSSLRLNESIDAMFEQRAGNNARRMPKLRSLANRYRQVRSVKANENPFLVLLDVEIVNIATFPQPAYELLRFAWHVFLGTFLSFLEPLCKSLQGNLSAGDRIRTGDVHLGKVEVCIGVGTLGLARL